MGAVHGFLVPGVLGERGDVVDPVVVEVRRVDRALEHELDRRGVDRRVALQVVGESSRAAVVAPSVTLGYAKVDVKNQVAGGYGDTIGPHVVLQRDSCDRVVV